jgi:hypothetical protein
MSTEQRTPRKPKQVAEVERRLRNNSKAAGYPKNRVYCYYESSEKAWHVCDNWDGYSPSSLVFHDDLWWRQDHEGVKHTYSYEQALGDTEVWFTG